MYSLTLLQNPSQPKELPPFTCDCGWTTANKRRLAMKNDKNELINPLPITIPNIVWDDLLYSDKEKIINSVKLNYTVTYYHTEHRYKKDISTSDNYVTTTDGIDNDTYVNSFSDTDVIKIEEIDSSVKGSRYMYTISSIFSRATSERGVINIDNPVPDIIPCNIWNNLPDVLKEEITKAASRKNNYSVVIDKRLNISFNPNENTITIHCGSGTVGHTDTYDAKRGVFIRGTVSQGI